MDRILVKQPDTTISNQVYLKLNDTEVVKVFDSREPIVIPQKITIKDI